MNIVGNWKPSRCIKETQLHKNLKNLVQKHYHIVKQLLVISRNTLTALTVRDSESKLTFISYRQSGNLSSLFLFCCLNWSQHPTFKMDKCYGFLLFFPHSLTSYREWLESTGVKHHLYTFIHFLSRFHPEEASQGGKFSCSRSSTDNEESLFPRALSHAVSVSECLPSSFVLLPFTDAY